MGAELGELVDVPLGEQTLLEFLDVCGRLLAVEPGVQLLALDDSVLLLVSIQQQQATRGPNEAVSVGAQTHPSPGTSRKASASSPTYGL